MSSLRYRAYVDIDDLQVGECTVRPVKTDAGVRWFNLWFRVKRDSDGQEDVFGVPINPNGGFIEAGPGGKTWGLTKQGPGVWQVSPSINVLDTRDVHPGEHPSVSLWHQTPSVVDVPDGECWQVGTP